MKIVAPFAFAILLVFGCSTQEISKNYISKPTNALASAGSETAASSKTRTSAVSRGAKTTDGEEAAGSAETVETRDTVAFPETVASPENVASTEIADEELAASVARETASEPVTDEPNVDADDSATSASIAIPAPAAEPAAASSTTSEAAASGEFGIARTVSVVPPGAIDISVRDPETPDPAATTLAKLGASPAPIPVPAPAVKKAEPKVVDTPASAAPAKTAKTAKIKTTPKAPAPPLTPDAATAATATTAPSNNKKMKTFAELDGKTVIEYTLKNATGCELKVLNYGCIVTSLNVPDRDGKLVDVVLGHDNLQSYQEDSPYFGAMVGRCGNRIANATFKLDGKEYKLAANNGDHSLHGGEKGFDKKIWDAEMNGTNKITFTLKSPDGDEGFPGNMTVRTTYTLTDNNSFNVVTRATSDAPTICNIVHHSYWNLEGHDAGKIYDHELALFAAKYTPADETLIPTGKIAPVAGTALDFTTAKKIGKDLQAVGGEPVGYDHNFVVDGRPRQLRKVAKVVAPKSGIVMEIEANQPGVQFYTGNFLDGHSGKGGADYAQHEGFCLETQFYPDSANKQGVEGWPSVVLRPGDTYTHRMNHKFSVAN